MTLWRFDALLPPNDGRHVVRDNYADLDLRKPASSKTDCL